MPPARADHHRRPPPDQVVVSVFEQRSVLDSGRRRRAIQQTAEVDACLAAEVDLPVTRVLQGFFSAGEAPQRLVIRSQAELTAIWDAMFHTVSPQPEIPTVDFSQEMVIIARAGAKPSGGYCISVDSAVGNRRGMTVTVRSGGPLPRNSILPVVTHPFDVVRVPRRDEVTFNEVSFVGNCGPLT